MVFFIESIVACALFTLFVFLMSRDPVKTIFNYPPAIVERCKALGLVDDSNRPGGPGFYAKKVVAIVLFGVLVYEMFGPMITKWALTKSGDIGEKPESKETHERFDTPKDHRRNSIQN